MRRLLGWLLTLVLLTAGLYFVWPLVQQAQRYAALLSAPLPTPSSLPLPLPGVRFADTWGGARSQGRRHEGVDIFAPRNTPVRATTRGKVLNVGPDTLGGRTVMLLGPGGARHYYAHLERYAKLKRGDWVKAGAVVGYVGDSGNAAGTPTHLHYGIYEGSGAVNPYPLLKKSWLSE
ncbi:M23 family metallopeptidase [Deinococcus rubellus]|uniref:M23 family metallopeptidase n=1 Tax=Deinococcus rubellus TaxID=1889240 RepID=A0ABY5YHI0_9DEIO|nr:M23 family metallopeptidase [Deinococcus rubellus]UWX64243.1 M23 family metallopeptidase [Deinococcus rubellus]